MYEFEQESLSGGKSLDEELEHLRTCASDHLEKKAALKINAAWLARWAPGRCVGARRAARDSSGFCPASSVLDPVSSLHVGIRPLPDELDGMFSIAIADGVARLLRINVKVRLQRPLQRPREEYLIAREAESRTHVLQARDPCTMNPPTSLAISAASKRQPLALCRSSCGSQ